MSPEPNFVILGHEYWPLKKLFHIRDLSGQIYPFRQSMIIQAQNTKFRGGGQMGMMAQQKLYQWIDRIKNFGTAKCIFLLGVPLLMGFLLGWNQVGMLKPWPTRTLAVLYWSVAIVGIWLLTYGIYVFICRRVVQPVGPTGFLQWGLTAAFLAQNLYRPFNSYLAQGFAWLFEMDAARVAPPWPTDFGNFLEWQWAFLPFIILWLLSGALADTLCPNAFLTGVPKLGKDADREHVPSKKSASGLKDYIDQLPVGSLISLSAEDHYVRVHSVSGEERFLARFSEALDLVSAQDGLRIHRSYWTAYVHIADWETRDGKSSVRLTDGRRLPVSARYKEVLIGALAHQAIINTTMKTGDSFAK